jgi:hypothetical protein
MPRHRPRGRPLSYADKLFRLRWVDRGRPTWPLNDAELSGAQKAAITRDWRRLHDEANRRYYRALRAERRAIVLSERLERRFQRQQFAREREARLKKRRESAKRRREKQRAERRRIRPRYKDFRETVPEIRPGVPHPGQIIVGNTFGADGTLLDADPAAVLRRLGDLAGAGYDHMQFLYMVPRSPEYPESIRSVVYVVDRPTRAENERIIRHALADMPNCFAVVGRRAWKRGVA